jgi:quercetin dioxygenase-like cupin family protein
MSRATPRPPAVPATLIDNDRTVTTEWRFAPGAETGWHTHSLDYVVVPMTIGTLLIELPDGSSVRSELVTGVPYFRRAGVEHNVVNANDHEFVFIEIEFRP